MPNKVSKEQKVEKERKMSGASYSKSVAEKAKENKEEQPPKVEGYAVYDVAANSLGYLVLDRSASDSKALAKDQFRRLHEHRGDASYDLRLVRVREVASTEDADKGEL